MDAIYIEVDTQISLMKSHCDAEEVLNHCLTMVVTKQRQCWLGNLQSCKILCFFSLPLLTHLRHQWLYWTHNYCYKSKCIPSGKLLFQTQFSLEDGPSLDMANLATWTYAMVTSRLKQQTLYSFLSEVCSKTPVCVECHSSVIRSQMAHEYYTQSTVTAFAFHKLCKPELFKRDFC